MADDSEDGKMTTGQFLKGLLGEAFLQGSTSQSVDVLKKAMQTGLASDAAQRESRKRKGTPPPEASSKTRKPEPEPTEDEDGTTVIDTEGFEVKYGKRR